MFLTPLQECCACSWWKELENVDLTLTEQIPVPSVPFMMSNRLINTLEVVQQGSMCWCMCVRWNVEGSLGRYVVLRRGDRHNDCPSHRCHPPPPAEGSVAALQGTLPGKLLVGHHHSTERICPNLLLPSCPAALRKKCTWENGIYFTWLAPARAVKQKNQKEKTCKKIQQSIAKGLSGLEAAKTPEYLAWLKNLSEERLLKHSFLNNYEKYLIKKFWRP